MNISPWLHAGLRLRDKGIPCKTHYLLLRQCIDALASAINKFTGGVVLATKLNAR